MASQIVIATFAWLLPVVLRAETGFLDDQREGGADYFSVVDGGGDFSEAWAASGDADAAGFQAFIEASAKGATGKRQEREDAVMLAVREQSSLIPDMHNDFDTLIDEDSKKVEKLRRGVTDEAAQVHRGYLRHQAQISAPSA